LPQQKLIVPLQLKMKRFFAILLILITAFYVLPVADGFIPDSAVTTKSIEEKGDEKESETKKEAEKEFIATYNLLITLCFANNTAGVDAPLTYTPVHYTVETPPPNLV
jgi:hypothetical protein